MSVNFILDGFQSTKIYYKLEVLNNKTLVSPTSPVVVVHSLPSPPMYRCPSFTVAHSDLNPINKTLLCYKSDQSTVELHHVGRMDTSLSRHPVSNALKTY